MAHRSPLVVVLAGPNGAGKSTCAAMLLRGTLSVDEFVNADTIAQGLSAYRPESAAFSAGRVMLDRLRRLARDRRDFAFETTLAGRAHAQWLRELREAGYLSELLFLALPSPDLAVARVAARVRQGGHHVAEDVIRRRFVGGLRNLFSYYPLFVDRWRVYDNSVYDGPRLIADGAWGSVPDIVDQAAWKGLQQWQT